MSYLSFENNIIEASGNLILKSNGDTIDCCGCNLINVSNIDGNTDINGNLKISSDTVSVNIVNNDIIVDNLPKAKLNIYGASHKSSAEIFLGQQSTVGAGIRYNGDTDKMELYNTHGNAGSESVVMSYNYNSNNVTFNGSVNIYDADNMFQTVLNGTNSYIKLDKQSNIISTQIGYLNPGTNVLHITNNADYIYLARYTGTVTPYLNIGEHIGGTAATDLLSSYKHVSNVMIEAPSITTDSITSSSNSDLTFTTPDNDNDIILNPHGTGKVRVSSIYPVEGDNHIDFNQAILDNIQSITSESFNGNVTNTSGLILTGGSNSKTFIIGENNKHVSNVVIEAPSITTGSITSSSNSDIILNPNGTGIVKVSSIAPVGGNTIDFNDAILNKIQSIKSVRNYFSIERTGPTGSSLKNRGKINFGVPYNDIYYNESEQDFIAPSITTDSITNKTTDTPLNLTAVNASGNENAKFTIGETITGSPTTYKNKSDVMIEALSFNATSDYRTKTNIEDLDETITVSNLRPLVYIKNGKKEIGLIAHELQEVYPFMVCGEKDGEQMQSVNYNGLIGVLINDVKRLNNENQKLKSEYETLKSENSEIKSRLDTLEEKFNKRFE